MEAERTTLIGRDRDVEAIERLLDAPERLVTIVGAAGVGKTRLALHVAARWAARRPDDVAYRVDLRAARSAEEIAALIAAAAEEPLRAEAALTAADQVGVALREHGDALLVLDDFDHLVGAAEATVGRLLALAPALRCLVTSRQALGIAGELRHDVAPLAAEDAVELFAARVQATTPGFTLTPALREVAGEIVARLDHLPLAIELAAARTVLLAPEEILGRLDRRLDLLRVDAGHRIGSRHSTLRDALEWSWSLLTEEERAALAALSVFEGGMSVTAAVAVVGGDETASLDRLTALREKSLLVHAAASPDRPAGETRIDLLQSVRELAAEKLDERGERDAAEARHAAHFLASGERWGQAAHGPGGATALRHLRLEASNLVVAGRNSLRRAPGASVRIALAVGEALALSGPHAVQLELLDHAVAAAEVAGDGALHARALVLRGDARAVCGRRAEAGVDLEAAAVRAHDAGDLSVEGHALRLLGVHQRDDGDFARARGNLERAVAIFGKLGERGSLGRAAGNLATLYRQQGRMDAARSQYLRALEHHREAGDRAGEGLALAGLGHLEVAGGDTAKALEMYQESLDILRAVGDRRTVGVVNDRLALLALERGEPAPALTLLDDAREHLAAVGDHRLEAIVLAHRAVALAVLGRADDAAADSEAAARTLARIDDARLAAAARALRACVALVSGGDAAVARRAAHDAAAEERRLSDVLGEVAYVEYLTDARRLLDRAGDGALQPAAPPTALPAPALDPGGPALEVGHGGAWVRLPGGEPQRLPPVLARLVDVLFQQRVDHPTDPISAEAIATRLWPDETLGARVAGERVYSAIAKLRRRGLEAVVTRQGGGYVLHPSFRCVRVAD